MLATITKFVAWYLFASEDNPGVPSKSPAIVLYVPLNAAGLHCSCTHESHILRRVVPFSSFFLSLSFTLSSSSSSSSCSSYSSRSCHGILCTLPTSLFHGAWPVYTRGVYTCVHTRSARRESKGECSGRS